MPLQRITSPKGLLAFVTGKFLVLTLLVYSGNMSLQILFPFKPLITFFTLIAKRFWISKLKIFGGNQMNFSLVS